MLAGGPGDVGGPSSASAITQALRWLTRRTARSCTSAASRPRAGGRPRASSGSRPTIPPRRARCSSGAAGSRPSGDALYDPATNTIYDRRAGARARSRQARRPGPAGRRSGRRQGPDPAAGGPDGGHAGARCHNGVDAWAISLKPDVGRPVWTLWVSAADGKPLELRDPGRDASEQPQVIRWPTYEVLPGARGEPRPDPHGRPPVGPRGPRRRARRDRHAQAGQALTAHGAMATER